MFLIDCGCCFLKFERVAMVLRRFCVVRWNFRNLGDVAYLVGHFFVRLFTDSFDALDVDFLFEEFFVSCGSDGIRASSSDAGEFHEFCDACDVDVDTSFARVFGFGLW